MPNKNKSSEGKTIFILKKENLFPEWGVFKKINEIIWWIVFKKVLIEIKKSENYVIITDYENKIKLENYEIKSKIFADYLKKYENMYEKTNPFIKNLFDFINKNGNLKYKNANLTQIKEEMIKYWLINIFEYIKVSEEIIKQEKPDEIIVVNKNSLIGKIIKLKIENTKIKLNCLSSNLFSILPKLKKYSSKFLLNMRFYNIPLINRKEFVKTHNQVKWKGNKRTLIAAFDNLYFSRLEPVIKEIEKQKELEQVLLTTNTDTQKKLKQHGLNFVSFGDYLNKKEIKEIFKDKKKFIKNWEFIKNNANNKIFFYNGLNLFEILKEKLEYLFKTELIWWELYIKSLDNLFKKEKINVSVLVDDVIPPDRAIVFSAKNNNVKTLVIQPGGTADSSGRGFVPILADKFAAWGRISKDYLIERGADSKKIVITGNPAFSALNKKYVDEDFYKKIGLKKGKKTIVLTTQAFDDVFCEKEWTEITKKIVNILKKNENLQLIIKIHPRENSKIYESVIKETKAKGIVILKNNLEEAISMSDLQITISSTTILDGLLMDKLVGIANFFNRICAIPFAKSGAVINIKNVKQLEKILEKIPKINKKKTDKFLFDSIYKKDGKSKERIVKLIKKMIKM